MSAAGAGDQVARGPLGTPLHIVFVGFAASALLLVLQTFVFQLLPWDSSASAKVSLALRLGFLLADVTMLVAFVTLARAAASERGLLVVGAALASFTVLSGSLGLLASTLSVHSPSQGLLRATGRAMSGAEPVTSIGTALLAALALTALAKAPGSKEAGRASLVTLAVGVSVALTVGFRLVRLVDSTPRSLPAAWASWLVEVTRPALVAGLAFALARAIGRGAATGARPEGPYRSAGEGPAPVVTKQPLAATLASLRAAVQGLSYYRAAFLARVAAAVAMTLLAFVVAFMKDVEVGMIVVLAAIPLAGIATALVLAVGLIKLIPLTRGLRAGGVTTGAIVAIGLAGLLDSGTLIVAVNALFESSRYRFMRNLVEGVFAAMPIVALVSGVSILFVASALRRLGELCLDDRVAGRARWVQGTAIGAGAAQMGAVLALLSRSTAWNDASTPGGMLVVVGLGLAALAATAAVVIQHVLLVSAARAAVLAAVAEPARAG